MAALEEELAKITLEILTALISSNQANANILRESGGAVCNAVSVGSLHSFYTLIPVGTS